MRKIKKLVRLNSKIESGNIELKEIKSSLSSASNALEFVNKKNDALNFDFNILKENLVPFLSLRSK